MERIARNGCCALDACSEDHTVLTVGPVALRLERRAFEQLTDLLLTSRRRLVVRDEHGDHWREIVRAPDLDPRPGRAAGGDPGARS